MLTAQGCNQQNPDCGTLYRTKPVCTIKKLKEAVRWAVPRLCLLLQRCVDRTDPGAPLAPASDPLQPVFHSQPSEPAAQLSSATGTASTIF